MRAEDLSTIRSELNRRRRLVLETARRAEAEVDGLRQSTASSEAEESAQLHTDAATLDRLGDAERLELMRIDAALARMDEGTYGDCADCGEAIEPRRLRALPHALRCQGCEEAKEQVRAR